MEKIPFNEHDFRNGGVALYADSMKRFCKTIDGELFAVDEEGYSQVNFDTEEERIEFMHKHYTMKSKPVDDWIPVKGDGTIPDAIKGAKAGEWKVRFRNAVRDAPATNPENYSWKHENINWDIVAVRRVAKKEEIKATSDNRAMTMPKDAFTTSAESTHYSMSNDVREKETPQQALTRQAYRRYKAAHPDPKPAPPALGEDGLMAAMAQAVKEHKI